MENALQQEPPESLHAARESSHSARGIRLDRPHEERSAHPWSPLDLAPRELPARGRAAQLVLVDADDTHDLFLAQGYLHAQDRFWEMDFRRHVTSGRLSELFGADQVETDAFIRTLGWRRVAEQELEILSPDTIRYLEAYADGVNAYLAQREGAALSLEYAVLGLQNSGTAPEPSSAKMNHWYFKSTRPFFSAGPRSCQAFASGA